MSKIEATRDPAGQGKPPAPPLPGAPGPDRAGGTNGAPQPVARAAPADSTRHKGTWWFPIVVTLALVLAGYGLHRWIESGKAAGGGPGTGPGRGNRPASVTTAAAKQGNLPVYLNALGTATAFNTVTVRSRVDGQLVEINFTEGKTVKAGDVLAKIDARPFEAVLHQAQGQRARDQASLENARRDLQRYQDAGEAASQQQRDTALAAVAQFEAAVKVDDAQVESARLQVEYCTIVAPLTGRIGLRLVDAGNMVHASDASGLAVITQVDPISVVFSLPQDSLPQVMAAAAKGKLVVEAYSRDLRTRLTTGELQAVDNQIDPTTATARLKARFANAEQTLFPNQFVNIRLLVDVREGAVLVPSSAVQRNPQGRFVYVVAEDETVSMQPVKEGPAEGEMTVIEEGLKPGQNVVTDGADKLVPGMKIVRPAAATQVGGDHATGSAGGAAAGGERRRQGAGGGEREAR